MGLVSLLEKLVLISSATQNVKGVDGVQRVLSAPLQEMGFQVQRLPCPRQNYADLLIATYSGEDPRFINLIGHADTVLPASNDYAFEISKDGTIARGAGIADDKAGLVVALEGLKRFLNKNTKPKYSLRFISSPSEELGSTAFIPLYKEMAKDSVMALGFEPSLEDGSIVHSRRGNRWYDVRVKGHAAHAGRSFGFHVNAAHVAAKKIVELEELTNYKKGVSVNVGGIQSREDHYNVVCDEVRFKLDTRFSDNKEEKKLRKAIQQILLKSPVYSIDKKLKSKITFEVADDCPSFKASRKSKQFAEAYVSSVYKLENQKIKAVASGGAGDVNHMSRKKGIVILDGLGAVSGKIHTHEEFVYLPSLETRAEALEKLLIFAMNKL